MSEKNKLAKDIVMKKGKSVPTIIIVRHGETDLNNSGRGTEEKIRGWVDVPLNEHGKNQAKVTAKKLAKYKISKAWVSDLGRTIHTAEAILKYHPTVEMVPTKKLRPWDLGKLTGGAVSDAIPVMIKHIKDENALIAGSSETFAQFAKSTLSEFKNAAKYAREHADQGAVLLVTHSRDTRLAEGWILAGGKDNMHIDKKPLLDKPDVTPPAGFMVLKFENGHWIRTI